MHMGSFFASLFQEILTVKNITDAQKIDDL